MTPFVKLGLGEVLESGDGSSLPEPVIRRHNGDVKPGSPTGARTVPMRADLNAARLPCFHAVPEGS